MGVVYEAQDTRLPRSVAIKVLKEELAKDLDAVRRFKREARLASSLNHPNICTILEVSEDESQSFIAMELLEGSQPEVATARRPLVARRNRRHGQPDCRRIGRGARAGHHSSRYHARQHLPGRRGPGEAAGFWPRKALSRVSRTTSRRPMSSPAWAPSLEPFTTCLRSSWPGAAVDYRCDFFALGAVLYQMATGARPFDIQPRNALSTCYPAAAAHADPPIGAAPPGATRTHHRHAAGKASRGSVPVC